MFHLARLRDNISFFDFLIRIFATVSGRTRKLDIDSNIAVKFFCFLHDIQLNLLTTTNRSKQAYTKGRRQNN